MKTPKFNKYAIVAFALAAISVTNAQNIRITSLKFKLQSGETKMFSPEEVKVLWLKDGSKIIRDSGNSCFIQQDEYTQVCYFHRTGNGSMFMHPMTFEPFTAPLINDLWSLSYWGEKGPELIRVKAPYDRKSLLDVLEAEIQAKIDGEALAQIHANVGNTSHPFPIIAPPAAKLKLYLKVMDDFKAMETKVNSQTMASYSDKNHVIYLLNMPADNADCEIFVIKLSPALAADFGNIELTAAPDQSEPASSTSSTSSASSGQ